MHPSKLYQPQRPQALSAERFCRWASLPVWGMIWGFLQPGCNGASTQDCHRGQIRTSMDIDNSSMQPSLQEQEAGACCSSHAPGEAPATWQAQNTEGMRGSAGLPWA